MAASALIVDDEEDICDFLKEELEALGLEVSFALTGEEALRFIRETKDWKIFIIDLKLSTGVSGMDLIEAIQKNWPGVPIAVMTGYIDIGLKQDAERLGISAFLRKPEDIQLDIFRSKVQALLNRPR